MLDEVKNPNTSYFKEDKVTKDIVLTFYILAKRYKLSTIFKSSLNFIEHCFPMVVETQNFLELDFSSVSKILASSKSNIHSEVEIFDWVITWIKHNSEERNKYAKQLLSKIRFTLLSEHALKHILSYDSMLFKNHWCVKLIKSISTH